MNVAAYGDAVSSVIEAHRTILQRVRPLWTLSLLSGFGWLDCVYSGEAEFQRWSGKVDCCESAFLAKLRRDPRRFIARIIYMRVATAGKLAADFAEGLLAS
jgi:hypothetical protein